MNTLTGLLSVLLAASTLLSGAIGKAAPQHDVNGPLFLVNRQYMISDAYQPEDLVLVNAIGNVRVRQMRQEAAAALEEMYAACKEETGAVLIAVSGFRDYSKQEYLYRNKLRQTHQDVAKAQEYVAPPGSSEHHLGLAMDIGQQNTRNLEVTFAKTEGGIWVKENCWRFGFILRYGEEWEEITGYKYEPWHFRYVGKELAKEIHEANVPLETWLTGYRVRVLQEMMKEATE